MRRPRPLALLNRNAATHLSTHLVEPIREYRVRSDPELRLLKDLDALFGVTRDERFVTARHCLQALWKVGVAGRKQQVRLVDALDRRFRQCTTEKNCTLVRYDIIESLRKMYDATADETLKSKATELIALEQDTKYRKKYARLWRDIS